MGFDEEFDKYYTVGELYIQFDGIIVKYLGFEDDEDVCDGECTGPFGICDGRQMCVAREGKLLRPDCVYDDYQLTYLKMDVSNSRW